MTIERANPEIVHEVMKRIDQLNCYVPTEDIELVVAAMSDWLQHSKRGLEYMAHLLQLDSIGGRHDQKYTLRDGFGKLTKDLKPETIFFLRGCVVENETIPVSQVMIEDKDDEYCEECGSQSVCLTTIPDHMNENPLCLCTYCIKGSEEYSMCYSPKLDCEVCTFGSCQWHPVNQDMPLLMNH
jgi:hypothetical protein